MYNKEKFKSFYKMIEDAKAHKIDLVLVACPEVLGDNYEEIIENLSLIADADIQLGICGRNPPKNK